MALSKANLKKYSMFITLGKFNATPYPIPSVSSNINLDGFFPTASTIENAVCVSECPTFANQTVTC